MTKTEAKKILVKCFKALPERDRNRLAYHREKDTTILCGDLAENFYTPDGGG